MSIFLIIIGYPGGVLCTQYRSAIFFSPPTEQITRRENFHPMVGGALEREGKEGQDTLLIRNQPTIVFEKNRIPRTNPCVCLRFFGPGLGWENEGTALPYQGGGGGK